MKETARGIIIKNEKILLIHRIRENNGICEEYYVVPGGAVEEGETIEETVLRELKEELGICVRPIRKMYTLGSDNKIHHYILCKYVEGKIGTGKGPEYTSKEYLDRGKYLLEFISLSDIANIPLQEPFKSRLLKDLDIYKSN